ncbi:platelet endothelial aggregation receptor 1-like [Mercenaria mercenaria]|uniref:platelet endothelial aggregation receptor 1-like n=1 Tax=Mercenaria mercenaria TaxID=6596 RepID=UPI001E1E2305|nr:platelet endothelial aggregation receptor 1-like [Mercenaria mercenaria]XP_045169292.1 platelet endothelial aggregation receptor 1-like [Mercenaria mercenaria]XP_045169293.1 platelet endothelial aggregation receptor 1-like [Mercenaria mercenaria]XP_045169294.1 platelet endothelial aggregation receptor 1-like [Mercenaria mercenaria]XP_045169295.1 platelet endothelial aggregation receptor 1-like [Mercenaria mercenaria]
MMSCAQCVGCRLAICNPGLYGLNCNKTCNPNCRAVPCSSCSCEVCNQLNGNCTNGCDSGWFGAKCETICPDKCMYMEGHLEICNRETGNCLFGCQNGYYGDMCNNTCHIGCTDSLCEKPNGTCVKGCLDGYKGDFCGGSSPDEGGLNNDEIAGALGGAFVVMLWATVVIVLIFVIWRRRLKNYEVFNRNDNFGNDSNRSSSRRRLRRHSSSSSVSGTANHILAEEQQLTEGQRLVPVHINKHRPLIEKRSVTFDTDSPVHCTCTYGGSSRDFYVCRGAGMEQDEYEQDLQNHLHEFHVHFTNEHDTGHFPTRRASSEGDISELSAVWKPIRY